MEMRARRYPPAAENAHTVCHRFNTKFPHLSNLLLCAVALEGKAPKMLVTPNDQQFCKTDLHFLIIHLYVTPKIMKYRPYVFSQYLSKVEVKKVIYSEKIQIF